jgi:uncharacterized RDD family membrane protein YckC
MGQISLETPQNVGIEFQAAGLGDRILARLIDSLLLFAYSFVVNILLVQLLDLASRSIWINFILLAPAIFYYPAAETLMNGQTFGKWAMKIRVVKLDATRPGIGSYLMRWLLFMFEGQATGGTLAIFAIAINGRGQRLGDLAAGTTVIKLKFEESINRTLLRDVEAHYQPEFPQVLRLNDRDVALMDQGLRKFIRTGNRAILQAMMERILPTLGYSKEAFLQSSYAQSPEKFINVLIKDYNHLTGKAA